jgi:hypothetical protein
VLDIPKTRKTGACAHARKLALSGEPGAGGIRTREQSTPVRPVEHVQVPSFCVFLTGVKNEVSSDHPGGPAVVAGRHETPAATHNTTSISHLTDTVLGYCVAAARARIVCRRMFGSRGVRQQHQRQQQRRDESRQRPHPALGVGSCKLLGLRRLPCCTCVCEELSGWPPSAGKELSCHQGGLLRSFAPPAHPTRRDTLPRL